MKTIVLTVTLLGVVSPCAAAEPDPQTVENLHAFAKVYGYVRFFHPSDEAASVDWNVFAVYGAEKVMAPGAGVDLAATLRGLFVPVAPTLRVFPAGEEPPPPAYDWPSSTEGLEVAAWQHLGVGLGPGIYRSARSHRASEVAHGGAGFGTVTQSVPARDHRGKPIRLRAAVKADVRGSGNQARLWLRVDREKGQRGFFDNMQERPITAGDWRVYEIEGTVADDAERIVFGGFLLGQGAAWFDAFELAAGDGEGGWTPLAVPNAGFEASSDEVLDWSAASHGYAYDVVSLAFEGERSVRVTTEVETVTSLLFEALPEPGERIREEIGAGLAIDLPLALWSDDKTTLGKNPELPAGPLLADLAAFDADAAGEAALNAGAVTVAWNVFQHFYPYFDVVDVDWDAQLDARLAGVLSARGPEEQYRNLRRLTAALDDGHANVFHPGLLASRAGVPLRLAWVEGEVVVTASGVDGVARGDVLVSIDGEAAGERLEREMELSSGTPQWKRYRALWTLTGGDKDAPARLVVRRGGEELTVTAARDPAAQAPPEFDRPPIDVLEGGVVYVDLRVASSEQVDERIDEIAAAPGVIFDLRGYPKGNHDVLRHMTGEPIQSAKWNVSRIIYPDRRKIAGWSTDGRWNLSPAEPRFRGKLAFLTDGSAISYAESVMGIVEAYKLAEIVGETTAGANGNVNPFQLPGGYRVTWTGMKVVKHDDSQHHLVGIRPTVPCKRTLAGVRAGRDEQLEKALEVVRGE